MTCSQNFMDLLSLVLPLNYDSLAEVDGPLGSAIEL